MEAPNGNSSRKGAVVDGGTVRVLRNPILVVVQFEKGSEPNAPFMRRKKRDAWPTPSRQKRACRGSPVGAARPDPSLRKKPLARDDNQTAPLPAASCSFTNSDLRLGYGESILQVSALSWGRNDPS